MRLSLSSTQQTVIAVIFVIMTPFIFLTNIAVCILLIKLKQMKIKTNHFIAVLCASDSLIGLIVCPLWFLLYTVYNKEKSCRVEALIVFPSFALGHFSLYMITIVALERYIRITYPLRHHNMITRKVTIRMTLAAMLVAVVCGGIATVAFLHGYLQVANFIMVAIASAIFLTIILIYVKALFKLVNSRKTNRVAVLMPMPRNDKMVAATSITAGWILTSLVICYTPCFVLTLINFSYHQIYGATPGGAIPFLTLLSYPFFYMNSGINAIIILSRNRTTRGYIVQKCRLKSCHPSGVR